jgi:XXXCH domain-containing protein
MSTKSIKFEKILTDDEIQPLCEALQNCLAKSGEVSEAFDTACVKKAEITVKKEEGGYKLKVKFKCIEPTDKVTSCCEATIIEDNEDGGDDDGGDDEDDEADICHNTDEVPDSEHNRDISPESEKDSALPRYKTLKKRMGKDFDVIKKNVKTGELPPADTVKRFMEDAQMMCRFRGKGDEHYGVFLSACDKFQKAFKAGDLEGVINHSQRLRSLEKSCHKEYK